MAARFKPGESGNPSGRPRGIPDKRSSLRALLEPHAKDLVAKVVELAKDGDVSALRICIDRLIPVPKAKDEVVTLEGFTDSPAECGRVVLAAVGDGSLTPEQGSTIMGTLSSQARIVEVAELEQRISALEAAQAKKG